MAFFGPIPSIFVEAILTCSSGSDLAPEIYDILYPYLFLVFSAGIYNGCLPNQTQYLDRNHVQCCQPPRIFGTIMKDVDTIPFYVAGVIPETSCPISKSFRDKFL